MADVRIDEVQTELEITDSVGPLSAAEIKKLVALVMEQLRAERDRDERRRRDDTIHDHAYVGPAS
jgi:hypothetical protein